MDDGFYATSSLTLGNYQHEKIMKKADYFNTDIDGLRYSTNRVISNGLGFIPIYGDILAMTDILTGLHQNAVNPSAEGIGDMILTAFKATTGAAGMIVSAADLVASGSAALGFVYNLHQNYDNVKRLSSNL